MNTAQEMKCPSCDTLTRAKHMDIHLDGNDYLYVCTCGNTWTNFVRRAVKTLSTAMLALMLCSQAFAGNISESQAVHAILGEARGEGYRGMYAVACAIRNRGTLQGVYGVRANVSDASDATVQQAFKAWHASEDGEDITFGATHWEAVKTFGKPYWAKRMIRTAIIGNHHFFKES